MAARQTKKQKDEAAQVYREYVQTELVATQQALKNTQIYGSLVVFGVMCVLFSIANGFANNLEPKNAATIAKGVVAQNLESGQAEISNYLRTEIPSLISSAPDYAKSQLPVYRENVESTLETEFEKLASESSDALDQALTAFLLENEDQFKTIILAGQDKETTDEVARNMKDMFLVYLTEPHGESESIQEKLDKSLSALKEIETKTTRLAKGSNLDPVEKKTRRAIACLFNTIDQNKDAWNLPSQEAIQSTLAEGLEAGNAAVPR